MLLNDGNEGSWLLPELLLASDFSFFNSGDFTGVLCIEAGLGLLCIEGGFGCVGAGLCLVPSGVSGPATSRRPRAGEAWGLVDACTGLTGCPRLVLASSTRAKSRLDISGRASARFPMIQLGAIEQLPHTTSLKKSRWTTHRRFLLTTTASGYICMAATGLILHLLWQTTSATTFRGRIFSPRLE